MGALTQLVNLLFTVYIFLIIGRTFMSWVRVDPYNPVVEWIYRLTEPVLAPVRNLLPSTGMVDWSPTVALFLLIILRQIVLSLLAGL
jgi:YggT family protein